MTIKSILVGVCLVLSGLSAGHAADLNTQPYAQPSARPPIVYTPCPGAANAQANINYYRGAIDAALYRGASPAEIGSLENYLQIYVDGQQKQLAICAQREAQQQDGQ